MDQNIQPRGDEGVAELVVFFILVAILVFGMVFSVSLSLRLSARVKQIQDVMVKFADEIGFFEARLIYCERRKKSCCKEE